MVTTELEAQLPAARPDMDQLHGFPLLKSHCLLIIAFPVSSLRRNRADSAVAFTSVSVHRGTFRAEWEMIKTGVK